MIDTRYNNHRSAALEHLEMGAAEHPTADLHMKAAHVEAMVYVGDQINRLCELVAAATSASSGARHADD